MSVEAEERVTGLDDDLAFALALAARAGEVLMDRYERLERIVPGHDMATFSRHPSRVIGLNPVAEVHLAAGERSRVDAAG